MFWVGLEKKIKSFLMNYRCMFTSFIFPIILGILFAITIPDSVYLNYSPIPVAIVGRSYQNTMLYQAMEIAKASSGEPLFNVSLCSSTVAMDKLANNEINAYIQTEAGAGETAVTGVNITSSRENEKTVIVKEFMNWYEATGGKEVLSMNMQSAMEMCLNPRFNRCEVYFLTLLVYAALLSAHWGVRMVVELESEQSNVAVRVMIAPVSKSFIILQNVLAVLFISFFENLALILCFDRLNNMNLISILSYVLLVQILTSIIGMLFGVLLGKIKKMSRLTKHKLCDVGCVISAFLAGLVMCKMKYVVDTKLTLIAQINPANIATDALFSAYYSRNMDVYTKDLMILCTEIAILIVVMILVTRRKSNVRL